MTNACSHLNSISLMFDNHPSPTAPPPLKLENMNEVIKKSGKPEYTYINEIDAEIRQQADQLSEQIKNLETLKQNRGQLYEYRAVLQECKTVIADNNYFA